MKLKITLFTLLSLCFIGCSNDDEVKDTINGSWKLEYIADTNGAEIDYSAGEVTWTFDEETRNVIVNNTIFEPLSLSTVSHGLPSGTYSYSTVSENEAQQLYINNIPQGKFAVNNLNLVIRTAGQNETIKVFKR